jgi:hypothetical protein
VLGPARDADEQLSEPRQASARLVGRVHGVLLLEVGQVLVLSADRDHYGAARCHIEILCSS